MPHVPKFGDTSMFFDVTTRNERNWLHESVRPPLFYLLFSYSLERYHVKRLHSIPSSVPPRQLSERRGGLAKILENQHVGNCTQMSFIVNYLINFEVKVSNSVVMSNLCKSPKKIDKLSPMLWSCGTCVTQSSMTFYHKKSRCNYNRILKDVFTFSLWRCGGGDHLVYSYYSFSKRFTFLQSQAAKLPNSQTNHNQSIIISFKMDFWLYWFLAFEIIR